MNFLRYSQFVTWPIAYLYFNFFYKVKINGRDNLNRIKSPFIIIVNHINFADSFLFRLILGLKTPHLPLRFMAVRQFSWLWLNILYKIGIIPIIYKLFGVFTVTPGLGRQKNLEQAKKILSRKGIVVVYPEGKIVTGFEIAPFKPGAAVLSAEMNVPVLPISLRIIKSCAQKPSLIVNIGEPILPTLKIEALTPLFKQQIESLYSNI